MGNDTLSTKAWTMTSVDAFINQHSPFFGFLSSFTCLTKAPIARRSVASVFILPTSFLLCNHLNDSIMDPVKIIETDGLNCERSFSRVTGATVTTPKQDSPTTIDAICASLENGTINVNNLNNNHAAKYLLRVVVKKEQRSRGPTNGTRIPQITLQLTPGYKAVLAANATSVKRPTNTYRSISGVVTSGQYTWELTCISNVLGREGYLQLQCLMEAIHYCGIHSDQAQYHANDLTSLRASFESLRNALCDRFGHSPVGQQTIASLQQDLATAQTYINTHTATIAQQNQRLTDKDDHIKLLQQNFNERENTIAQLKQQLVDLEKNQEKIAIEFNKQLVEEGANLQKRVQELQGNLENMQETKRVLEQTQKLNANLQKENSELVKNNRELRKNVQQAAAKRPLFKGKSGGNDNVKDNNEDDNDSLHSEESNKKAKTGTQANTVSPQDGAHQEDTE